jgi:chitin disaccharide deacetylase
MADNSLTNELLGYSASDRLLILNADDFGMCHSINEGILRSIRSGVVSSCTLMVPCPWSLHAMQLLTENPDIPFGVHLTAVCEHAYYRWRPLRSRDKVPSLLGESGYFFSYDRIDESVAQINRSELEIEFRAQIETVFDAGLKPTHLDSHCHVHTRREDLFDMVVNLGRDYGLAVRAHMAPLIVKLHQQGLPGNDHEVLDSYHKEGAYNDLLRNLPAGLTEWAIHPGLGSAELQAMEPTWEVRQTDFEFFTSPKTKDILAQQGIIVLNYRPLQKLWRQKQPASTSV